MSEGFYVFLRDFSTLFVGLISAIVGSIYYYKYKDTILKYFLIYLWVTISCEYLGYVLREYFDVKNNGILFNVYFILSYIYLSSLYLRIVKNPLRKKAIYSFYIIYLISIIIGSFYENYLTDFLSIPFVTASFLLVIQVGFYFAEVLNSERVFHIKRNLFFWISIGLLIFYVGNIPFRIAIKYYVKEEAITILFSLFFLLIILLNTCYIIGFIWSDKKQRY